MKFSTSVNWEIFKNKYICVFPIRSSNSGSEDQKLGGGGFHKRGRGGRNGVQYFSELRNFQKYIYLCISYKIIKFRKWKPEIWGGVFYKKGRGGRNGVWYSSELRNFQEYIYLCISYKIIKFRKWRPEIWGGLP